MAHHHCYNVGLCTVLFCKEELFHRNAVDDVGTLDSLCLEGILHGLAEPDRTCAADHPEG